MTNKSPAIVIDQLSKEYQIGQGSSSTLRQVLSDLFGSKKQESFYALKDLDLTINQGDSIAIIGKNGAGKSTLLKVLSKITKPSAGSVKIYGRVSSLLEVGTGFHPELTGKENIFLNGSILGMTQRDIRFKLDEIVDFSGVESFLDTPVKHYSSGMYVRLAFAVAAHLEPEILIVDEVLAVGDLEFQEKSIGKMNKVAAEGRTVVFVSHNLSSIRSLCQRGIVLEQGTKTFDGSIEDSIRHYRRNATVKKDFQANLLEERTEGNGKFRFKRLWIEKNGVEPDELHSGDRMEICCEIDSETPTSGIAVCRIYDDAEVRMATLSSAFYMQKLDFKEGTIFKWVIDKLPLTGGQYSLEIAAFEDFKSALLIDEVSHALVFEVQDADYYGHGVAQSRGRNKLYLDFSMETT